MKKKLQAFWAKLSGSDKEKILQKARQDLQSHQVERDKIAGVIEQLEKTIKAQLEKLNDSKLSRIAKDTIKAKAKEIHESIQKKEKIFHACNQQIQNLNGMILELERGIIGGRITAEDYSGASEMVTKADEEYLKQMEAAESFKQQVDNSYDLIRRDQQDDDTFKEIEQKYAEREKKESEVEDEFIKIAKKYTIEE